MPAGEERAAGGDPIGGARGDSAPAPAPAAVEPLATPGLVGEVAGLDAAALAPRLPALLDPAAAARTLHWGRNYLWVGDWPGVGAVVVKQFRHESPRARLRKRLGGSKARKSFAVARALRAAGVLTPEPLLWADSRAARGPSWFVTRLVEGVEARYPLRALAAGRLEAEHPDLAAGELLDGLGRAAARIHDAGVWHRDLSAGNLLLCREGGELRASVVDLNRARRRRSLGIAHRLRDLARLPVFRPADQEALLAAYFGAAYFGAKPSPRARALYRLLHGSFHGRHRLKNRLRARRGGLGGLRLVLRGRRPYPHLPPPPAEAGARDRVVWDPLSDQPHQHAGRGTKLRVRIADAPAHLRGLAVAAAAAPRVRRRYRELMAELPRRPVPWGGAGVALRPYPQDPAALLAALAELGVRDVLLRLHPWQDRHDDEEALARELHARGHRLVFALPQRRELVRDLPRWRAAVRELGERFVPYGEAFQVGQAINRSKWGVWSLSEYQALLQAAAEELRAVPGTKLAGPGVIDFEPHVTAAVLGWPGLGVRFDALASLLYVDRRGAPEARQLGFDAVGKAALLRAIGETAKWGIARGGEHWVTEVNWPLREGPHAPAGRDVAVDEETAADYLARYYLLLLGSGLVQRVYWWQLVARGYGLTVAEGGALRRRPAFHALATMQRELAGSTFVEAPPAPPDAYLWRFAGDAGAVIVGWSAGGVVEVELPAAPRVVVARGGTQAAAPARARVALTGSPRYFRL